MKRARPPVFADSSSESDAPHPRIKRPPPTPTSPPLDRHQQDDDTLEAFMTRLHAPSPPPHPPPHHDTSSSDDQFVVPRAPTPPADLPDPVPPVDTTTTTKLPPIRRPPYTPPPQTPIERTLTLTALAARVANGDAITPLPSFASLTPHLPRAILPTLAAFRAPTAIQSLAIPALLSHRDVIAVAATGSGKTLAYAVPLLAHVARQRGASTAGRGPAALVLAPTRELALQIAAVLRGCRGAVTCVIGGVAKYQQYKTLRDAGGEVVVATPGRLIDMLRMRACAMARCSFVVLDEADRMLDMGFGPQVDALLRVIRHDAQLAMFSATFPRVVQRLAAALLKNAVTIEIRETDAESAVNDRVGEVFVDVGDAEGTVKWLKDRLPGLLEQGLVILFCATRGGAADIANRVRSLGHPAVCVHGETDAADRHALLKMFKKGEIRLLVTTDVSARGLDIPDVRTVVNCGCAKSWEWHVHRVGRTGRAGRTGTAYTLVTRARADAMFVQEAFQAYRKAGVGHPEGFEEIVKRVEQVAPWRGRGRGKGRMRARGTQQ